MLRSFLDGAVFGTPSGQGPPRVLLLHGWRRTRQDFAEVSDELASRGIAAVALDLPGFGASPPPAEPVGARGYAALLAPLVSELGSEAGRLVVVGHSFGGRVATCIAATQPDVIAGVVLSGVPLVRAAMPTSRRSRRYQLIRTLASWHLVSDVRLEAARRRYGSADYRAATGVMRGVLVASVAESYEHELSRVSCPVTFVWGGEDTTVPPAVARAAAEIVSGSSVEMLEGVGHHVPTESPAPLVEAIAALCPPVT